MIHLPDLDSLYYFTLLAHSLNFRTTAHRVALSPSALSDRIKKLEQELGGPLFIRTTRTVRLSPLGAHLLPFAQTIINSTYSLLSEAEQQGKPMPYTLKLGTRFELGLSWVVPYIQTLKLTHPERSIELFWVSLFCYLLSFWPEYQI